jgi:hypothetical protein
MSGISRPCAELSTQSTFCPCGIIKRLHGNNSLSFASFDRLHTSVLKEFDNLNIF